MNVRLSEKRERYLQRGLHLQPSIYNVGNRNFYVKNDEVTYILPTILKAVDTAIKLHSVLNLQYDVECEGILTFIQKYFYDIDTEFDRVSPSCAILLKKLEKHLV